MTKNESLRALIREVLLLSGDHVLNVESVAGHFFTLAEDYNDKDIEYSKLTVQSTETRLPNALMAGYVYKKSRSYGEAPPLPMWVYYRTYGAKDIVVALVDCNQHRIDKYSISHDKIDITVIGSNDAILGEFFREMKAHFEPKTE